MISGISAVSLGSWAMFQFAPKLQGMLDGSNLLGGGGTDRESSNKSLQPLYNVFYKFAHNSADEWINWILVQDKETQNKAFEKLKLYLEEPPEELGIATQEVIKAVVRFKDPASFNMLNGLLVGVRPYLSVLKCIDLFYADLCKGILDLDTNNGIKALTNELQMLKQRESKGVNIEDFKIAIVKALGSIKVVSNELREIFTKIITDRNFSGLVRKELIRAIKDQEDSVTEYIYIQALKSHLESSAQVLNKDHQTVLEELFYSFKHFIAKNNPDIWSLLIQSCYNDSTQDLFANLIISLVINPEEIFHEDQLSDILYSEEPLKDRFRGALAERFKVSNDELSLFKSRLRTEEITFDQGTIILEKSKKTKVVTAELLPIYHKLEIILNQEINETNKAERKSKHAISLMTGTGNDEKIYILRGLAANTNRSFVYIDLTQMIHCSTELNKLISTISNSKPSIVYVDKVLEIFKKNLNTEEEIGLKHFLKSVRELSILPTVSFFGSLSVPEPQIAMDSELTEAVHSNVKGNYKVLMNIDKPNQEAKATVIQNAFKKINPEKIDSSFSLDELLAKTTDFSLLQFLSFTTNFLEKSLMLYGKVGAVPKETTAPDPNSSTNTTTNSEINNDTNAGTDISNDASTNISSDEVSDDIQETQTAELAS